MTSRSEAPDPDVVIGDSGFHGVYLLYCMNERYLGRTYIGYTTDPRRRLRQHNAGCRAGGARRTNQRGPWQMVLVVHGFGSSISALRFEWAWQHPRASRRLRQLTGKRSRESRYDYCIRVLSTMLDCGPWCRLPLTVCWLQPSLKRPLTSPSPPSHIAVMCGSPPLSRRRRDPISSQLDSDSITSSLTNEGCTAQECSVCGRPTANATTLHCLSADCRLNSHVICLARVFSEGLNTCAVAGDSSTNSGDSHLLPVEGLCPLCHRRVLWGDLVRKRRKAHEIRKSM